MSIYNIDKEYILNTAKNLMEFHSPSGFCREIIEQMNVWVKELGYEMTENQKGCGFISIPGKSKEKVIANIISMYEDLINAIEESDK